MSRATLLKLFEAAVDAAQPARCLPPFVPEPGSGKTWVVGAGKASAQMALALAESYPEPLNGIVVTRYGHGLPSGVAVPGIDVIEAGHPLPDLAGVEAADRILEMVAATETGDRLIFLASGGGSALLVKPAAGVTLEDKQAVTSQLLSAGADIHGINCVRKHLSAIKGGWLARAARPATIEVLAISDVPGDHIADIASGPCSPDAGTLEQARELLRKYDVDASDRVWDCLSDPSSETPKPGDPLFDRLSEQLLAGAADALGAAVAAAAAAGFEPVVLGDDLGGPARELGLAQAGTALEYAGRGGRLALISGGETTVRVENPHGRGGRNSEYLLALAIALDGAPGVCALAADTDGTDGTENNAGAMVMPDTLDRARAKMLDPEAMLLENRSYDFFRELDDLVTTGPTGTNVNDFRVILISS